MVQRTTFTTQPPAKTVRTSVAVPAGRSLAPVRSNAQRRLSERNLVLRRQASRVASLKRSLV